MSAESEVSNWKYSHFLKNEKNNFSKNDILSVLPKHDIDEAYKIISRWDNYFPTPLISLNKLSEKLKLNKIFYKDESKRFHLKSFKALGGAYAVEKETKGTNSKKLQKRKNWQNLQVWSPPHHSPGRFRDAFQHGWAL